MQPLLIMEIRDKIILGAGKLFTEKGIRLVTMDLIAQNLGVSKRTIYENFTDKEELLSNYLQYAFEGHRKKAIEILSASENVIEAMFNYGIFSQDEMMKINPLFFSDIKKYHSDIFFNVVKKGEMKNQELTFSILKRGQSEEVFIADLNLEIANRFIHNVLQFCHKEEEEEKHKNEKVWNSAMMPYVRGICTDRGLKLLTKFLNDTENINKEL